MRCLSRQLLPVLVLGLCASGPGTRVIADERSTELLRYVCSNDLGRRDITLFANGTVRLREGLWEDQQLFLDELRREELGSYVAQLRRIQSGAEAPPADLAAGTPEGSWVDVCQIRLALPDAEPATYAFSALEVTPLEVSQLIHVAEDLASFTLLPAQADRLPRDYAPRAGDILRTPEGDRYEVVALTSDEGAVELDAVDAPLRIYVARDELVTMFAVLEEGGVSRGTYELGEELPAFDPAEGGRAFRVQEVEEDDDP